jgi:hypothetical protein
VRRILLVVALFVAAPSNAGGTPRANRSQLAAHAAARLDLTRQYQLKRCPGTIHAGFTNAEPRRVSHYGRYKRISCARARAIVRLIDHLNGPYPAGYSWEAPSGDPSTWSTVFGHVLRAVYFAPDGFHGSKRNPGVAVITFG